MEVPGANVGGGGAGEKLDGKEGVVGLVWPSVGAGVGALKVNALEFVAEDPKPLKPENLSLPGDCRK